MAEPLDPYLPLTSAQRSIWLASAVWPSSPIYNIGGYVHICGHLDRARFEEALQRFLARTDNFRLRFEAKGESTVQFVEENARLAFKYVDLRKSDDPKKAAAEWMEVDFEQLLPVGGEWYGMALLQTREEDFYWYAKLHHLIGDGYTLALLFNRVGEEYDEGERGEATEKNHSYLESVRKGLAYKAGGDFSRDRDFWAGRLSRFPDLLPFGLLGRTGRDGPGRTGRKEWRIEAKDWEAIEKAARSANCSPYQYMITALYTLLGRVFQREFSLGVPLMNRTGRAAKSTGGLHTTVLPLALRDRLGLSFSACMEAIRQDLRQLYRHRRFNGDDFRTELDSPQRTYNLSFSFQQMEYGMTLGGHAVSVHFMRPREQFEDLVIHVLDYHTERDRVLQLDFRLDSLEATAVERLGEALLKVCREAAGNMETAIGQMELGGEVRGEMKEAAKAELVTERFKKLATERGEAIAVRGRNEEESYGSLWEKVRRIGGYLKENEIQEGDVVAVVSKADEHYPAVAMALMAFGCVLLPIEPDYPSERIHYMLSDSGAKLCLAMDSDKVPDSSPISTIFSSSPLDHFPRISPAAPAYMIYTSGTTGRPKGVLVSHASLANYIAWAAAHYADDLPRGFACFTSIAFDLTLTSVFLPLYTGGALVLPPSDSPDQQLLWLLQSPLVDLLKLTPAHLRLVSVAPLKLSQPKTMILGGAALGTELVQAVKENFHGEWRIFNEYGPTEATVGCMSYELDAGFAADEVPIGKAAAHAEILLLDLALMPVPEGLPGEICIGGPGIALGYHDRPELNEERFIPHPFSPGKRLYRSGDWARMSPDGKLLFLGRRDRQMKVHGYRIEAAEVEKAMTEFAGVEEAHVGKVGELLVAWARGDFELSGLRLHLASRMPAALIPAQIHRIEAMPLNSNGKIDETALKAMADSQVKGEEREMTRLEALVAGIVKAVLGKEKVRLWDNFFAMGGDSIKAMQVAARLNAEGYRFRPEDVFTAPTVEGMAAFCEKMYDAGKGKEWGKEGAKVLLPAEQWFLNANLNQPSHFHQSLCLEFKEEIDPKALEKALNLLLQGHPSLRINLAANARSLFYNPLHLESGIRLEHAGGGALESYKQNWDLKEDLLFKAALFSDTSLFLTAHHLLVDRVSWSVLLEDLDALYGGIRKGERVNAPLASASHGAWLEALRRLGKSENEAHWARVEAAGSALPLSEGPLLEKWQLTCGVEETRRLIDAVAEAPQFGMQGVLLTAIRQATRQLSNEKPLKLELETHGRMLAGVEIWRTTGWFTCAYPILVPAKPCGMHDAIQSVHDLLSKNGLEYARLKYAESGVLDPKCHSPVDLCLNYLGNWDGETDFSNFNYLEHDTGRESDPENKLHWSAELIAKILDGKLQLELHMDPTRTDREAWAAFFEALGEALGELPAYFATHPKAVMGPAEFDAVQIDMEDFDALFE